MKAIIQTGGKQYMVEKGQILNIELLDQKNKRLEFDPLLIINNDDIKIGTPAIKNIKVKAEIINEKKDKKIKVLKFKAKKRVKKLTGHRQHYLQIKITNIA